MKQQTAVEWLIEQVKSEKYIDDIDFEQAKAMEKKQIMNAYLKNLPIEDGVLTAVQKAEQYYNETFKSE